MVASAFSVLAATISTSALAQTSSAMLLQNPEIGGSAPPVPTRPLLVTDFAYPLNSIIAGEEGTSRLNVVVDTQGRVTFVQLLASSGSSRLDQAGLQVAKTQWQFEPAKRNGEPVVGAAQVEINWKLPTRPANEFVSAMTEVPVSGQAVVPPSLNREAYRITSSDYPPASARAGEIGEVALKVFVLEDGSVGDVRLFDSSFHPRLDDRAVAIARERFKYKPGTVDGKPTAMWLDVLNAFLGTRDRRSPPPPNAIYRFCHSRPIMGTMVDLTSTDRGGNAQDGPILVMQWIHLTPDGSVDDVVMATNRGWMHLSPTLVADYTRAARQRAAVPDRPPSCWYNGSGMANPEPPKAVSVSELLRRGTMYLRQGQLNEALNDFNQAVELQPSNGIHFNNRCYTLALMGRAQEALVDCEKSLDLRPRSPATLDSRGFVYLLLGRYDDAMSDYTAVLRVAPKMASSLYGRGIAKIRMGNEAEGRGDIAEAMKIDQNITARMTTFGFAP